MGNIYESSKDGMVEGDGEGGWYPLISCEILKAGCREGLFHLSMSTEHTKKRCDLASPKDAH